MDFNKGDVLFVLENEGSLSEHIANVEIGYDGQRFNHCAIYIGDSFVIEARKDGVVKTPVDDFMDRSDEDVMVGRVSIALGKKAANFAISKIGQPYNDTFMQNADGYYCTQLVTEAYKSANGGKELFALQKLVFPTDSKELVIWKDYYAKKGLELPVNDFGSNPGSLSKDKAFSGIYYVMYK